MATKTASAESHFHWSPQPAARALLDELLSGFLDRIPGAATLAQRMRNETGTRFIDWVDYVQVRRSTELRAKLKAAGFARKPVPGAPDCFAHEGGIFPRVVLGAGRVRQVGVKVDSVIDFLSAWHVADDPTAPGDDVEGGPMAPMRRARAFRADDDELWAVERHGYAGFAPADPPPTQAMMTVRHLESFRRRARDWGVGAEEDEAGLDHADHLIDAAVADLGVDAACDLFFIAEREYWQRKNRAAQLQKTRQDRLGLGWANHDHHTYRSSRRAFRRLIALFEKLGFTCRERFYAGAEAGWGAQVLEQPVAGITIFADVDLPPDEVRGDFAHDSLPERDELGTVGLWCGLHGEAILQAGMHHLECQFDHEALKAQLEAAGVETMDPFTNFPFLKQAFTVGERWRVDARRIDALLGKKQITPAQASQFRSQGAIGSHLENLERNDGYKGFNQHGVSKIISKTDPRMQVVGA